jgi:hypothetical protein
MQSEIRIHARDAFLFLVSSMYWSDVLRNAVDSTEKLFPKTQKHFILSSTLELIKHRSLDIPIIRTFLQHILKFLVASAGPGNKNKKVKWAHAKF